MSDYLRTIYQNYPKSFFPIKLANYLADRFFPKEGEILDVCCGNGEFCKFFNDKGLTAYGVDRDYNTNHLWQINRYKRFDLQNEPIPHPEDTFDYVFTKSAIEHFPGTDEFLNEIYRVLKPGGQLVILTPAWEYNYKDFFNDYTHLKPFHRKGLQDALKIHRFKDVNVEYFYYLPFTWKYPWLKFIPKLLSPLSFLKWKDKEETRHRPFIRFCQEVQLLASAKK